MFPYEVLEMIFSHLPVEELLKVQILVCKQWHDVISLKRFLKWKKICLKYQKKAQIDNQHVKLEMKEHCDKYEMTDASNCIQNLIKYMAVHHNPNMSCCRHLLQCLEKHSQYSLAHSILNQCFSDFPRVIYHPWSIITIIVCVIADSVWDVHQLFQILIHNPESNCTVQEVIETLSCICAHLLYFKDVYKIPSRSCYNLQYALHLYENHWLPPCSVIPENQSHDLISSQLSSSSSHTFVTPTKRLMIDNCSQDSVSSFGSFPSSPASLNDFDSPMKWTSSVPSSQESTPMKSISDNKLPRQLTSEQMRIVNHSLHKDDLIRIIAFAGTGKTSTLIRFTEKRPDTRFVVIVFNKSVQLEAEKRFPSNVKCFTAHKLGYDDQIPYYTRENIGYSLNAAELQKNYSKVMPQRPNPGVAIRRSSLVMQTLDKYWSSADEFITPAHVPSTYTSFSKREGIEKEQKISDSEKMDLSDDAKAIWKIIANRNDKRLKMSTNAMLKLWQLSKPDLTQMDFKFQGGRKANCILIDEGQDMDEAMLDVFLRQKSIPRIIVGDPHQQIYQWRFAINALDSVSSTHTYYLTQSFRFGPEIGFLANSVLEQFKQMNNQCLVGAKIHDTIDYTENINDCSQVCIIGRTNMCLFQKIVTILLKKKEESKRIKIAFVSGIKAYNFDKLLDLDLLRRRQNALMKNRDYKRFPSLEALKENAENLRDVELCTKISMVMWSGDKTVEYVNMIQSHTVFDSQQADIVVTTAHKCKGLEWDNVMILEDFTPNFINIPTSGDNEEANLLYVAITRAKKKLYLNPAAFYTHLLAGYQKERVVSTATYLEANPTARCAYCFIRLKKCQNNRIASLETTLPLTIKVLADMASEPGILCSTCAGLPHIRFPMLSYKDLSKTIVKADVGHISLNFALGPPESEKGAAQAFYQRQHAEFLKPGFRRPRVVVDEMLDMLSDGDDDYIREAVLDL